ncbi:hypothetical protein NMY22_g12338 [Coprinellus aureogranulatus]|nr:hypothetical protein NMY22_g12338 [Coprinellus aureogranulatus]
MVTTRRQSGAVPKAEASKASAKDTSDGGEGLSGASEEEVDDEPRKTRRKTAAQPKAKRQKTKATADSDWEADAEEEHAVVKAPKRRRGKDLSLLVTMPLDILFEILGQLSPKDLLSVSQTNKTFHKTLLAPSAKSVWISAREHGSTAPEPPDGFSEARWAGLLFKNVCQACGAGGVVNVDFMLMKRICTSCKKTRLVYSAKFKSKFPDWDKEILDYILYTNVGGHSHGHRTNSQYYWGDDIHTVWKEWSSLKNAAQKGLVGAKDKFDKWKAERVKWVEDTIEVGLRFDLYEKGSLLTLGTGSLVVTHGWYRSMKQKNEAASSKAAEEHRIARFAAVKQRFADAGYDAVDIDAALSVETEGIHKGTPTVTNAVWTRLKPKLEPLVIAQKEKRLNKELQTIVTPRMQIFKTLFEGYLAGVRPLEKLNAPSFQFLRAVPEVAALIDAPKDVTVTASDFQPVLAKMPEHVSQYLRDYREAIAGIFPASDFQTSLDPLNMARFVLQCSTSFAREVRRLLYYGSSTPYYATSIVTCSSGPLHGWSMVTSHLHCDCKGAEAYELGVIPSSVPQQAFTVHEEASVTATSIIALVGLDPMTATIADMDEKGPIFACVNCSAPQRYPIYNWRQAVHHAFNSHLNRHSWIVGRKQPTFRVVSSEEAEKARAFILPLEQAQVWSCNHCSSIYGSDKATILEHLQSMHNIEQAEVSRDYFVNEKKRHGSPAYVYDSRPQPKLTSKNPQPSKSHPKANQNYQCLQCGYDKQRRFMQDGVISHLKAKHNVASPQEGVDYKVDPNIAAPRA